MSIIAFWPDGSWEKMEASSIIPEGARITSVDSESAVDIEIAIKKELDAVNIRYRN